MTVRCDSQWGLKQEPYSRKWLSYTVNMLSGRTKQIILGIIIVFAAIGLAWGLPLLLGTGLSWYLLTAVLTGMLIWAFWIMWRAWRKLQRHELEQSDKPAPDNRE